MGLLKIDRNILRVGAEGGHTIYKKKILVKGGMFYMNGKSIR